MRVGEFMELAGFSDLILGEVVLMKMEIMEL